MQRILRRGKHTRLFPYRTISQIRKLKKKTQVLVPVHAAGEHRPAELFRYNIILQKSQNHGKKHKEDQSTSYLTPKIHCLHLRRQDQPVMTTQPHKTILKFLKVNL